MGDSLDLFMLSSFCTFLMNKTPIKAWGGIILSYSPDCHSANICEDLQHSNASFSFIQIFGSNPTRPYNANSTISCRNENLIDTFPRIQEGLRQYYGTFSYVGLENRHQLDLILFSTSAWDYSYYIRVLPLNDTLQHFYNISSPVFQSFLTYYQQNVTTRLQELLTFLPTLATIVPNYTIPRVILRTLPYFNNEPISEKHFGCSPFVTAMNEVTRNLAKNLSLLLYEYDDDLWSGFSYQYDSLESSRVLFHDYLHPSRIVAKVAVMKLLQIQYTGALIDYNSSTQEYHHDDPWVMSKTKKIAVERWLQQMMIVKLFTIIKERRRSSSEEDGKENGKEEETVADKKTGMVINENYNDSLSTEYYFLVYVMPITSPIASDLTPVCKYFDSSYHNHSSSDSSRHRLRDHISNHTNNNLLFSTLLSKHHFNKYDILSLEISSPPMKKNHKNNNNLSSVNNSSFSTSILHNHKQHEEQSQPTSNELVEDVHTRLQDDHRIPRCSSDGQLPYSLTANLCRGLLIYRPYLHHHHYHYPSSSSPEEMIAVYLESTGSKHWRGLNTVKELQKLLEPFTNITILITKENRKYYDAHHHLHDHSKNHNTTSSTTSSNLTSFLVSTMMDNKKNVAISLMVVATVSSSVLQHHSSHHHQQQQHHHQDASYCQANSSSLYIEEIGISPIWLLATISEMLPESLRNDFPEHTLLRGNGGEEVYVIMKRHKCLIISGKIFMNHGWNFAHVKVIDSTVLAEIPTGPEITQ